MRTLAATIVVFILPIAGCMTYTFDNVKYSSDEQAYSAQRQRIRTIYAGITPAEQKIGGRLLACFPDADTIYENATVGGPSGRKYVAHVFEEDYKAIIEVVKLRAAFDQVDVQRTKGDSCTARDGDVAAVYLYMPNSKLGQWYFTSRIVQKEPLYFDRGEPDYSIRFSRFSKSIEDLAAKK